MSKLNQQAEAATVGSVASVLAWFVAHQAEVVAVTAFLSLLLTAYAVAIRVVQVWRWFKKRHGGCVSCSGCTSAAAEPDPD